MMPGKNAASARPERSAKMAAIVMPNSELSTNFTVERCTILATSSATASPTEITRDRLRFWETIQVTVKPSVGMAPSTIPRFPPSAFDSWLRTNVSSVTAGATSVTGSALELIPRVVDDPASVVAGHPSRHDQPHAGLDARDLAPSEPHERHHARAVVQRRLQG